MVPPPRVEMAYYMHFRKRLKNYFGHLAYRRGILLSSISNTWLLDWPFLITNNIVCTDIHCSIKMITTLVALICFMSVVGIRSDVLVKELSPVNSKRPQLASELRVGGVEASHPSDGLREVFRRWLMVYGRHCYNVLAALKSVGEKRLASELKVNFEPQNLHS